MLCSSVSARLAMCFVVLTTWVRPLLAEYRESHDFYFTSDWIKQPGNVDLTRTNFFIDVYLTPMQVPSQRTAPSLKRRIPLPFIVYGPGGEAVLDSQCSGLHLKGGSGDVDGYKFEYRCVIWVDLGLAGTSPSGTMTKVQIDRRSGVDTKVMGDCIPPPGTQTWKFWKSSNRNPCKGFEIRWLERNILNSV
ncbi:MAG: hypothetical protein M1833_006483 [Piccolia ochrophora]|nr:MAG: hypothetical protein M1833_006483 [Piccolia ochrophora]